VTLVVKPVFVLALQAAGPNHSPIVTSPVLYPQLSAAYGTAFSTEDRECIGIEEPGVWLNCSDIAGLSDRSAVSILAIVTDSADVERIGPIDVHFVIPNYERADCEVWLPRIRESFPKPQIVEMNGPIRQVGAVRISIVRDRADSIATRARSGHLDGRRFSVMFTPRGWSLPATRSVSVFLDDLHDVPTVAGFPEGEYDVLLQGAFLPLPQAPTRVTVSANMDTNVTFDLPPTGDVEFLLTSADAPSRLAGRVLFELKKDGESEEFIFSGGPYILTGLAPGKYRVRAMDVACGALRGETGFEVAAGGMCVAGISMKESGSPR
jgi:hypothetical protein